MADFYQTGLITTLHRLGNYSLEDMERELEKFSKTRPVTLVLPCLYQELEKEAIHGIVNELKKIKYLRQIVISMSRMNEKQFRHAQEFFSVLPQDKRIVWHDGPRVSPLFDLLEEKELGKVEDGKGRAVWIAFGYVLAARNSQAIALHDCDITSYKRDLVARLCYPLMNRVLAYEFVKGFYARISDRLHGRVTRLFFTPLVRSLQKVVGHDQLLLFLDSFRYPLAGEFGMSVDLARTNRIPGDWGLEVGTLAEVYRNCAFRRVAEVDIADVYEHKHQELSAEDPGAGLFRMSTDIAKSLFRTLASEGILMTGGVFRTLRATYVRMAQDQIKRYHDDAAINGMTFDRHEEASAVETFSNAIDIAAQQFMDDPLGAPLIPNWNRVVAAIPDILEQLKDAVEADNENFRAAAAS